MEELDEEMIQFEKDHPAKNNRKESGSKAEGGFSGDSRNLKTIVIVLASVAAALLIALVAIWISKSSLVKELNIDKQNLETELIALQNDYETLSTTNVAINDSLNVEKEKVEQLIERLQSTEATNRAKIRQYEKELGTLRSIMKSYIVQIDSLNTLNTNLRNEASAARREAQESRRQYQELQATTEAFEKKVSEGAVVKGRGVMLTAINSSNKETDRSRNAAKLMTCLSLIENAIAERGPKTVYIRVKSPDGVLLATDAGNVFTCEGEQMVYSASREVDYQGEEVEICIYFSNPEGFVKGIYTVDVYTEETQIGSADLNLR